MYLVYLYHDPDTKQPFYAGMGVGNRWMFHLRRKDNFGVTNKIRQIRSRGKEPVIGVWNVDDQELAHLLEIELISKYGRRDRNTGILFNLTDGGEGRGKGYKVTDETKKKIALGNKLSQVGNKNAAGIRTEEHKKRMSNARKNVPWSPLKRATHVLRFAHLYGEEMINKAKAVVAASRGDKI